MTNENIAAADGIASCLIEHLVYNVPSETFGNDTLQADVRATLIHLYNATLKDESCESWVEMNGMEWLFKGTKQPWSRQKVNEFIVAGWQHLGFE